MKYDNITHCCVYDGDKTLKGKQILFHKNREQIVRRGDDGFFFGMRSTTTLQSTTLYSSLRTLFLKLSAKGIRKQNEANKEETKQQKSMCFNFKIKKKMKLYYGKN